MKDFFFTISEKQMQHFRWLLTTGWLLLIFSLFYDPYSLKLTEVNLEWSIFRLNTDECVLIQGVCSQENPYPVGVAVFWGIIVPSAIFIFLVFGHDLWRRVCPLSFLSQIPKALGIQRQIKRINSKTGTYRYELAKVKNNSWLAKNYLYVQFGLLYLGLCSRILLLNSDRFFLGLFILLAIISAIIVGYLYGGKSWCNYFCPMAPVQKFYCEPRGLFNSKAHDSTQRITQSMCRTTNVKQEEKSACVACQSPCIDIDAERDYWNSIDQKDRQFLHYAYPGLVVGFFLYFYLYAGNWNYYFSGVWTHEENLLDNLFQPGFYIFEHSIPIPKLVAVPLTLGLFTILGYWLGKKLEKKYKAYLFRRNQFVDQKQLKHRTFSICKLFTFNFFFIFGGQSFIPDQLIYPFDFVIIFLSSLWFYRTWSRSFDEYNREKLSATFRKKLDTFDLNIEDLLEGKSIESLNTDEVYVLAKIIPDIINKNQLKTDQEDEYKRKELFAMLHKQLKGLGLNTKDLLDGRSLESLNPDEVYVLAKIIPDVIGKNRLKTYKKIIRESLTDIYFKDSNQQNIDKLQKKVFLKALISHRFS